MSFTISVDSSQVVRRIRNMQNSIQPRNLERGMRAGALIVEGQAKINAPIDIGNLKNSIDSDAEGLTGYVYTNVEYAPHQEYGTSQMSAQPYMRPAVENRRTEVVAAIAEYVTF